MRTLEEGVWVAARQIRAEDVALAAAEGIRILVNNRPDHEEPGQPQSCEIEAAAGAAGLAYRHIPVAGVFPPAAIGAMAEALTKGPALIFCRSGTRSTWLWALARASEGADGEWLIERAAEAGYDLSPLRPHLVGRPASS